MNQPTFQQIGDLYHALWELQREVEESEKKAKEYKGAYETEYNLTWALTQHIQKAREYLRSDQTELALQELEKV